VRSDDADITGRAAAISDRIQEISDRIVDGSLSTYDSVSEQIMDVAEQAWNLGSNLAKQMLVPDGERICELERERDVLRVALAELADLHHRTLMGSRLHDPLNVLDFTACTAKSCRAAAEVLGG
jgi:hypothetical protein